MSGRANLDRLIPGDQVWVCDPDPAVVWSKVEFVSKDDKAIKVKFQDQSLHTIPVADPILLSNKEQWSAGDGLCGVQDLVVLTHLHEPEVLQALQLRFDIDQIYTFCGPILIALNPFKTIANMYSSTLLQEYVNQAEIKSVPHIWTVARRAFVAMTRTQKPQCVLISGESGAGKTEATKQVLKYLVDAGSKGKTLVEGQISTEQKVLNSNPLLEAFGNACTVRNKNSSRFGKFIELQFLLSGSLVNFDRSAVEVYLLEKVRITEIHANERSYHIFYQACAASERLKLPDCCGVPVDIFGPPTGFAYLKKSARQKLDGVDDAKDFQEVLSSMESMGMDLQQRISSIETLCAVLHCGNIQLGGTSEAAEVLKGADGGAFDKVANLLKVDGSKLVSALTHKRIVTPGETFDSPIGTKTAEERRDALARILYGFLFLHIVKHVNSSLGDGKSADPSAIFIGVLDIFGFEHFEVNSFEQLCINFANERLQKVFNDYVFLEELKLYKAEGIPCDAIDFPDNMEIIDLIQGKKCSVFGLLDQECRLPGGSDQGFCEKIKKEFANHSRFEVNKLKRESFTVRHFAGPVPYHTAGFLDKNKDELGCLLKNVIGSSDSPFVAELLAYGEKAEPIVADGKRGTSKKPTVSMEFNDQLESLVTKIDLAGPSFVRCLKPNQLLRPDLLQRDIICEQLRSGGVIEALHVQRAGYPCRSSLSQCWRDICILFNPKQQEEYNAQALDVRLRKALAVLQEELKLPLMKAGGKTWAVGKTTVFFKQEPCELVRSARSKIQCKAAISIQNLFRAFRCYRLFYHIRHNMILIQSAYRGFRDRAQHWEKKHSASEARRRSLDIKEEAEAGLQAQLEQEQAHLAEEERLIEEERRFKEADESRRRAEEEGRRLEEQRRGENEAAKKAEETRVRLQESERLGVEFQEKLRMLQEEQRILQDAGDGEIQRLKIEMECQKKQWEVIQAECERKIEMLTLKEKTATSGLEELQTELRKAREEVSDTRQACDQKVKELGQEHTRCLEASIDQQEATRLVCTKQMDEMRTSLEEVHRHTQGNVKQREEDVMQKFDQEVRRMKDREIDSRRRHEEVLSALRKHHEDQRSAWHTQTQDSQNSQSDKTDKDIFLRQIEDIKTDNEAHLCIVENQREDTRRMYQNQLETAEKASAERVASLLHDLEMFKQQMLEAGSGVQSQLEYQRTELMASCQQEVDLVKRQAGTREKSLMQMLEQARRCEGETQKTKDAALILRQQQQAEFQRCSEARVKHIEEATRRQQELYDQHVAQLTKQLAVSQEAARRQLEEAGSASGRAAEASLQQLTALEERMKYDQDRMMSEASGTSKVDTTMLYEKVSSLERENEALKRRCVETKSSLQRLRDKTVKKTGGFEEASDAHTSDSLDAARTTGVASEAAPRRSNLMGSRPRHSSAPVTEGKRRVSVRWAMMPEGLADAASNADNMMQDGDGTQPRRSRRESRLSLAALGQTRPDSRGLGGSRAALPPSKSGARMSLSALEGLGNDSTLTAITRAVATTAKVSEDLGSSLLRPSLRQDGRALTGDVGIWRELATESAVTVLSFSANKPEVGHTNLAVACRSGVVLIFRFQKTQLERAEASQGDDDVGLDPQVVVKFQSHAKAVTFMCFGHDDRELLTTSTDWTVRLWSVQDGKLLYELADASLVVCALPVPRPLGSIVIANANSVLRLVDRETVKQKVRLDNYARALVLGLGGTRLLAGTSRGSISAFSLGDEGLSLVGQLGISKSAVTCLTIAPCDDGAPPLVAANSMDCTICLLQANPELTNFTVLKRIANSHKLLPIRCCHVASVGAAGFCVTGSEDTSVRCIDLDTFSVHCLSAHIVPVVDVATTGDSMLLASADVLGRIILWRRGCDKAAVAEVSELPRPIQS